MKPYQLLALLTESAIANPALIGKTVFDSVVEQADRAKRTAIMSLNVLGRQAPPLNPRTTSAADASKFNKAGSGIKGDFPRDGARPLKYSSQDSTNRATTGAYRII
ncbi:hypothetical protein MAN_09439, partial [Metarhizium hybridum]